ncbi:unnamed protein product [Arabis nemorensis]|uniref:RING-type domain-containing protein n=1 Tax=Arabis nemorensis TaxID=586526 RepID=A0A565CSX4_9BRAS|nr:unnamed protein product [Arabis nemorensis]
MTSIDTEIRPRRTFYPFQAKAAKRASCVICFDDDIHYDLMFYVGRCGHWFCLNCVKQHIEVKLLDGKIPDCLERRWCKFQLSIDSCVKLLTPKLSLMWEQRIKEDSTPLNERIYCPYQSCSYLMSKSELLASFSICLDVGDASNAVAPSASTAKFHGIIRYRAPSVDMLFATRVEKNGTTGLTEDAPLSSRCLLSL